MFATKEEFRQYLQSEARRVMSFQAWLILNMKGAK